MPLRRFSAREYLVDFVGTMASWPVYVRREWLSREWLSRERLDAFALDRTRVMATFAAAHVPLYRDLYRAAGVDVAPRHAR